MTNEEEVPLRLKLEKDFQGEALRQYKKSTKASAPEFTNIKQMYVIERLNDCFGIFGWWFDPPKLHSDEKNVFADIVLHVKVGDESKSIPFTGGAGKHMGSDAYKSAITDGLTKCASILGIGIKIFKGEHDPRYEQGACRKCGAEMRKSATGEFYGCPEYKICGAPKPARVEGWKAPAKEKNEAKAIGNDEQANG